MQTVMHFDGVRSFSKIEGIVKTGDRDMACATPPFDYSGFIFIAGRIIHRDEVAMYDKDIVAKARRLMMEQRGVEYSFVGNSGTSYSFIPEIDILTTVEDLLA